MILPVVLGELEKFNRLCIKQKHENFGTFENLSRYCYSCLAVGSMFLTLPLKTVQSEADLGEN